MLHEPIASQQTSLEVGSAHLRSLQGQLPVRAISLWDAAYGCAPFLLATADIPSDKVIRLRPNLFLASPPKTYKGRGRHLLHGAKLRFKGLTTWREPDDRFEMDDPDLGKIHVHLWKELHLRKAADFPMRAAQDR